MARPKLPKYGAADVFAALEKRYERGAWALFSEVGNATGYGVSRHADAVAMSLWPSRGLELHGIEIKVARHDWLRELAKPEKSDPIQKYCDRWWVAVANDTIVQAGELPPTWGLLVLEGGKMKCATEAPKLSPAALDRAFVAALLRRADEGDAARVAAARAKGREEGEANGPADHERVVKQLRDQVERAQKRIEDFERASGVQIDTWRYGDVGKAVRTVLELRFGRDDGVEELERIRQYLGNVAANMDDTLTKMKRARKQAAAALKDVANG